MADTIDNNGGGPPSVHVHFFSWIGLMVMAAILIAGSWMQQPVLVALTGTVLAVAAVTRGWSRLSLLRLVYERRLEEDRAFPGEEVLLTLRLENRKLLPLAWVEVSDHIGLPVRLDTDDAAEETPSAPGTLTFSTSLFWYQRAVWRQRVQCIRRGYYTLGPATVSSSDIFGLFPRSMTEAEAQHLIVYPKVYDLAELGLPSRHPLGEAKAVTRIFEDPTRTIGIRGYTPEVPFKHIHWKASARHQDLQVKVFEPTTTLQVALFLDVDGFSGEGDSADGDLFELAVSTAASLANYVSMHRHPVGLFVNAVQAGEEGPVILRPGSGPDQLAAILEGLARVSAAPAGPFGRMLESGLKDLAWGSTIGLVTAHAGDAVLGRLTGLQRDGFNVVVFQVGPEDRPAGSVVCHRVRTPDDLAGMR